MNNPNKFDLGWDGKHHWTTERVTLNDKDIWVVRCDEQDFDMVHSLPHAKVVYGVPSLEWDDADWQEYCRIAGVNI